MASKGWIISDCKEGIPCNPCEDCCKFGALIKETLTTPPLLMEEKCVGCKLCVAGCPGQALYYLTQEDDRGTITFPYEYLPYPEVGMEVALTDREGKIIGKGWVETVDIRKIFNETALVTLKGEASLIERVRGFRRGNENG